MSESKRSAPETILPWALLRASLLSPTRLRDDGAALELDESAARWLALAIADAAPDLASCDSAAARRAHRRYQARACTRSTPYRLFAAVGPVRVGSFAAAEVGRPDARGARAFLSWSRVPHLVSALLSDPRLRAAAGYRLNETVTRSGSLLEFLVSADGRTERRGAPAAGLDVLLADPLRVWSWPGLRDALVTTGLSAQEAQGLFEAALAGGLIVCDLEPALIGPRPEAQLATRLSRIAPESDHALRAGALCALTGDRPVGAAAFEKWSRALDVHPWVGPSVHPGAGHRAFRPAQIVSTLPPVGGGVPVTAVECARRAVLALPQAWSSPNAALRRAIGDHLAAGTVGQGIALKELVGRLMQRGILPARGRRTPKLDLLEELAPAPAAPPAPGPLATWLLRVCGEAAALGTASVELDPSEAREALGAARAPACAHAELLMDLSAGAPLVRTATTVVGRLTARFLCWDDADPLLAQLRGLWAQQERALAPALLADASWGRFAEGGDVGHRPAAYLHQLVAHGEASVPPERQIQLDDLEVFLAPDGAALFSRRLGARVIPRDVTAAVPDEQLSPFLAVLAAMDPLEAHWSVFGPLAQALSALPPGSSTPRLTLEGAALAPRMWRLPEPLAKALGAGDSERSRDLLARWRERCGVPDRIRLGAEGNGLDLRADDALEELASHLRDRGAEPLEELLADDRSLARSDDGPLACEAVAYARLSEEAWRPAAEPPGVAIAPDPHVFSPGSRWTYFRLHARPALFEPLLAALKPAIAALDEAGAVANLHFVRYADPDPHLRLRVESARPARILEALGPVLDEQRRTGLLVRWALDTYEREVWRYGGPELIGAAEELFTADSRLALEAAEGISTGALEGLELLWSVRTIHALLRGFGYDLDGRLGFLTRLRERWEREFPNTGARKRALADHFRREKAELVGLLLAFEGAPVDGHEDDPDIAASFERFERAASQVAARYRAGGDGALSRPLEAILFDVIHMHCNRLHGDRRRELVIHTLNQRATEAVHVLLRNRPKL